MKVLTIGGGAREHAMVDALVRSGAEHYSIMGNNNPGISRLSKEVRKIKETEIEKVVETAKEWGIELAVVGPEAPLGAGIVDALEEAVVLREERVMEEPVLNSVSDAGDGLIARSDHSAGLREMQREMVIVGCGIHNPG